MKMKLLSIAVITTAAPSMETQVTQLNNNNSMQVVVPLKWTMPIQNFAPAIRLLSSYSFYNLSIVLKYFATSMIFVLRIE